MEKYFNFKSLSISNNNILEKCKINSQHSKNKEVINNTCCDNKPKDSIQANIVNISNKWKIKEEDNELIFMKKENNEWIVKHVLE